MAITVSFEENYLVFFKDGMEFYDIEPKGCNGYSSIMECLETKTWFTPEVKAQVEKLIAKD